MCLTNIGIVDGIDCLQVLQHADGSEKYLTVRTGTTSWIISDTIDEISRYQINFRGGNWIVSASAGDCCAASVQRWKKRRK